MNVIWMTVVGIVIGIITSMFVRGSRMTGMAQTVLLGIAGYGGGGLVAERMGASILVQWLVGIVLTLVFITSYIVIANARGKRHKEEA